MMHGTTIIKFVGSNLVKPRKLRIAGIWDEIWSNDLSNANQECYPLEHSVWNSNYWRV